MNVAAGVSAAVRNTWEHFAHGADIGVRGIGPTKEAAFEQIALALTGVVTDLKSVRPERRGQDRLRSAELTTCCSSTG